jgi:hypothetical protein
VKDWIHLIAMHHDKDLTDKIAKIALDWACLTLDKKISEEALYIFLYTNRTYEQSLIDIILLNIFDSIKNKNDKKIEVLLKIIDSYPVDQMKANLKTICDITVSFLTSWNKTLFTQASKLLIKLIDNFGETETSEKLSEYIINSLKYFVKKESMTFDSLISKILVKGLCTSDTFADTFLLYDKLTYLLSPLFKKEYSLLQVNMILHFTFHTSNITTKHNKEYEYLSNLMNLTKKFDELKDFEGLFSKYSHINSNTNIPELNNFCKDFVSVYSKQFGNNFGNNMIVILYHLIEICRTEWLLPLKLLFTNLFPVLFNSNWKIPEYQISYRILKECVHESNEEIVKANSKNSIEFLIKNLVGNNHLYKN